MFTNVVTLNEEKLSLLTDIFDILECDHTARRSPLLFLYLRHSAYINTCNFTWNQNSHRYVGVLLNQCYLHDTTSYSRSVDAFKLLVQSSSITRFVFLSKKMYPRCTVLVGSSITRSNDSKHLHLMANWHFCLRKFQTNINPNEQTVIQINYCC